MGRFGMGQETLGEVWDGCGHPVGGPGWVGGPTWRLWTVRETLGEVGTGRGNLVEVRDGSGTLGMVWDGSEDPRGGV